MATKTVKYEDRLREYLRALQGDNWMGMAREFNGFAASTAEKAAELAALTREMVGHPGYQRRNDKPAGDGKLYWFCEFCGYGQHAEGEPPVFVHPPWCLRRQARDALGALDGESQP